MSILRLLDNIIQFNYSSSSIKMIITIIIYEKNKIYITMWHYLVKVDKLLKWWLFFEFIGSEFLLLWLNEIFYCPTKRTIQFSSIHLNPTYKSENYSWKCHSFILPWSLCINSFFLARLWGENCVEIPTTALLHSNVHWHIKTVQRCWFISF